MMLCRYVPENCEPLGERERISPSGPVEVSRLEGRHWTSIGRRTQTRTYTLCYIDRLDRGNSHLPTQRPRARARAPSTGGVQILVLGTENIVQPRTLNAAVLLQPTR